MNVERRFANLYRGLTRAHGIYELLSKKGSGKKIQGKARTVRGDVTHELWEAHLNGKQGLGIVPVNDEGVCWFGAIDIDQYDVRIEDVEARCAELRLPLLPTRTKSGGVHLYCFAKDAVSADVMKTKLEEWAEALGFAGSEVFPKQARLASERDVGNWINMPYFNAANGTTERYGIFKGKELSLEEFVGRAEKLYVTEDILQSLELPVSDDFANGPPCLQSFGKIGFPEGMRNKALFAVGVYLKKRWPDDWQRRIEDYNNRYMKPPLQSSEVVTITKSLSRKDYNYACKEAPCKLRCNRTLCRTREFGVGSSSDEWDVVIGSDVLKILTDPPYWIITVNDVRMELFDSQFQNQREFQRLCMSRIDYLPPALPPDRWREEVNRILMSATKVEAPEDSGAGGELMYHLQQFCTVHPQAESREEMLVGKPYSEEGRTYFRSADFRRYLDSNKYHGLSGPKLYAYLREKGLKHGQFWVAGRNIMVWSVGMFDQTPVEVPAMEPKDGGM